MTTKPLHNFHIPVMGLAYTIDSPIRVAQYGISSVISIIDDEILEKMKNFYTQKFNLDYFEITTKTEDYRAKRITAYLDMVDDIVNEKFESFKQEVCKNKETLKDFIAMLPNTSDVKNSLQSFINQKSNWGTQIRNFIESNLKPGNIDVNIMTKVDKDNYQKKRQLPVMYNDAHASLRGFANSKLSSSMVLSAGMNPRLYSYMEEFDDFFPDQNGVIKKKIILKVSDFRSAMIQGNFLAKKGLWVSEYRIESGLNCGGHAFATDGMLLGPIMEEFKHKKEELVQSAHTLMINALEQKGKPVVSKPLEMKITVQGGVGTSEEHQFLLSHYTADSVGWGSPFLLVPEATSVDSETRNLLVRSKEEDLYLSTISPLGVPFNTVKGTSNEKLKHEKEAKDKFGSSCPKKLLALSKEFSPEGTCTASKKYQDIKLKELQAEQGTLTVKEFDKRKSEITDKACLCVGLVNSAYMEQNIKIKGEKQGVVICPGPNIAFFDKEVSLSEMVQHIYGNRNILSDNQRPNMFINELKMYIDYLKKEIANSPAIITHSQTKKWNIFKKNIAEGIEYYHKLFDTSSFFTTDGQTLQQQLLENKLLLDAIEIPQVEK
ncbi:hypothetical protein C1637_14635 [Chryseobacterium lactis]|uniref:Uncharacterized protein n=1 Tax=Chryseobacterium lactis TaxID=1241981 RepID=A0A3G6RII2_CHRLC|nr:hypothetical protein [Chryseobacterium lactis]AZA83643.1 hypothetical protein EG342_17930 [Chryseobacterium lactis]AZB04028.1 hypothetical protein EG341_08805 [Chryseobacterium lactis]PNW13063.1 hypothetical protein C1637_14635 [Chryseobacterium lactis]